MAVTYSQIAQSATTTGGVEILEITDPQVVSPITGFKTNKPFSLQITLHSGDFDFTIVPKGSLAPTMDAPKWTTSGQGNPVVVPVPTFNPSSQDLYINSTAGSQFSITW